MNKTKNIEQEYLLSSTKIKKNGAGFTLMEIVVSTTIFVFVFVGLLSLFNYTLKINRRAEALRQATQGMRNFVEFLVKEIRNGQLDYYVINGTSAVSAFSGTSPCRLPVGGVGTPTYANKSNWLGIINTDGVQQCFYYGKADGSYVDTIGNTPITFSSSTGGSTLVLEKAGVTGPQILNTPNFSVENLMFVVRPTKDPYTIAGGLVKTAPAVSFFIKFIVTLPTGERVPIFYQTSVATNQYDIPSS